MSDIDYWSVPKHGTKILPLRWIGNYIFEPISMYFFNKALRLDDYLEESSTPISKEIESEMSLYYNLYYYLNKPYQWWGTVYSIDIDKLKETIGDMEGTGWDDYDENGIPYWDYNWHEDPETGDAWRLIKK